MTAPVAAGNRRGRETRRRILAAAEERFASCGIALTVDEVAEAAGTTRMTVHRHTGGRDALLTHLVLRASARLAAAVAAALDGPGAFPERLVDGLTVTVMEVRAAPHLHALFTDGGDPGRVWPAVDPDARVLSAVHAFYRPYFDAAEADGLLRSPAAPTTDWVLQQVLLYLVAPSSAPEESSLRLQLRHFVLPAILA